MLTGTLRYQLALWAVALLAAFAGPVHAAGPVSTDNVEAELVSDVMSVEPGGQFWVALRQKIRPGWHTYWKNPGDSGAPTRITWDLPVGFEAGDILWPTPKRIPVGPLINYGFGGEILLITQMTAPSTLRPGPVPIKAYAEWLVCEEICIPEEAELELILQTARGGPVEDPLWASRIKNVREALPGTFPWSVQLELADGKVRFGFAAPRWAQAFKAGTVRDVHLFPEKDGVISYASTQTVRYGDDGFTLAMDAGFQVAQDGAVPSEPIAGLLVVEEEAGGLMRSAFSFAARPGSAAGDLADTAYLTPSGQSGGTARTLFLRSLLFALLGGLILNLMPCVFPVLSMKALNFIAHSKDDGAELKRGGLAYSAGVILSFAALGGLLLVLRGLGEQIGWGFQLQSPLIIILIAYVIFAVGLNLAGVFEVSSRFADVGSEAAQKEGLRGSFLTGVLAVLVATPCTAPFMGVALGYALFQPAEIALSIFIALGLGLALPYLVLSFVPGLAKTLPRPGPWMETVKKVLSVPMFATVIWLLWVLGRQVQWTAVVAGLLGLAALAWGLWQLGQRQRADMKPFAVSSAGLVLAALIAVGIGIAAPRQTEMNGGAEMGLAYEPYSPERVQALRASGKHVFVNFTAAWCITCLVNEKVVFSDPGIREYFADGSIAYVKADWTNRDPVITHALAQYDRAGVPLYLLYPAGGEDMNDAMVLPQILTTATFSEALESLPRVVSGL